MSDLRLDLRYAFRQMGVAPGFWTAVILTITIGVAMCTAMFAVFNTVVLRALPHADADRLVRLEGVGYKGEYLELKNRSHASALGAYQNPTAVSVSGAADEPRRLTAARADHAYFAVLQTTTLAGRFFEERDTQAGAPPTAVLSYRLWRQQFSAAPTALGASLTIDGVVHTVIGVASPDADSPVRADIWLPLSINASDRINLWSTSLWIIGRLQPGQTRDSAQRELVGLVPTFRSLFPWKMPDNYGQRAAVRSLRDVVVGNAGGLLLALLGCVALVMMIACVNVSHLLLTRGFGRARELAIRAALGAGRARLVRQLVVESLVAATLASIGGTIAAAGLVRLFVPLLPADLPRINDVSIDGSVLLFSLSVSLLSALAFGVLPALLASAGASTYAALRVSGSQQQPAERRSGRVLAVSEFALASLLVVVTALISRGVWTTLLRSPGFDPQRTVSATLSLSRAPGVSPLQRRQAAERIIERVSVAPGVDVAAGGSALPFRLPVYGSVFIIEGRADPARSGDWPGADVRAAVTTRYFSVLGVSILQGRAFAADDVADGVPVAIVSEALARRYWPDRSPIGERVRFPGNGTPWMTIVGVAADVHWRTLDHERSEFVAASGADNAGALFVPLAQSDTDTLQLLVRTSTPDAFAATLPALVRSRDATTVVSDISTMQALIDASLARPRFAAQILSLFAGVALLLAAVGVYAVLSYSVKRQTPELALRLALGCRDTALMMRVLLQGARLTALGTAVGALMASAASSTLSRWIPMVVNLQDRLVVIAATAATLAAVGVVASYLPARRVLSITPLAALNGE